MQKLQTRFSERYQSRRPSSGHHEKWHKTGLLGASFPPTGAIVAAKRVNTPAVRMKRSWESSSPFTSENLIRPLQKCRLPRKAYIAHHTAKKLAWSLNGALVKKKPSDESKVQFTHFVHAARLSIKHRRYQGELFFDRPRLRSESSTSDFK